MVLASVVGLQMFCLHIGLGLFAQLLTFAQVVVSGSGHWHASHRHGLLVVRGDRYDTAILAHFQSIGATRICEHRVTFELGDHALDGGLGAELLAAANALERLFLFDDLVR